MIKRYSLLIICIFLTSCGFHLRGLGGMDIPPWFNKIAIIIQDASRNLGPLVREQLQSYNLEIITDPTQAQYLLILEHDGIQQEITNVAASTVTRQYVLTYDVQFSLVKTKGDIIIPPTHILVTRRFTVNNNRILSSDWVENLLNNEMRQEAVIKLLNQLSRELRIKYPTMTTDNQKVVPIIN